MSEQAMSSQGAQGLKYYLIRTSKLFSRKGKSKGAKPSFFDLMLDLSEKKQELNVVNEETSCFTYTPDLAGATTKYNRRRASLGDLSYREPRTGYLV